MNFFIIVAEFYVYEKKSYSFLIFCKNVFTTHPNTQIQRTIQLLFNQMLSDHSAWLFLIDLRITYQMIISNFSKYIWKN